MVWQWRFEGEGGTPVAGPDIDPFTNQSDAESWLGEHWRDLVAEGVTGADLFEDSTRVYGPLSLVGLE